MTVMPNRSCQNKKMNRNSEQWKERASAKEIIFQNDETK